MLLAGVLGVGVGVAVATVVGRLLQPARPVAHVEEERRELPVRVPPGWDSKYLSRLSAVESRLGSLEKANVPGAVPSTPTTGGPAGAPPERERDSEIAEGHRKDLAYQEQSLSRHQQEPRDEAWAGKQTEVVMQAFKGATAAEHPMRIGRVDCRSATCVAELIYPTPDDAAEDRGILRRAQVTGCHGMSSALAPPTGPGEYTTTVIYYCR